MDQNIWFALLTATVQRMEGSVELSTVSKNANIVNTITVNQKMYSHVHV